MSNRKRRNLTMLCLRTNIFNNTAENLLFTGRIPFWVDTSENPDGMDAQLHEAFKKVLVVIRSLIYRLYFPNGETLSTNSQLTEKRTVRTVDPKSKSSIHFFCTKLNCSQQWCWISRIQGKSYRSCFYYVFWYSLTRFMHTEFTVLFGSVSLTAVKSILSSIYPPKMVSEQILTHKWLSEWRRNRSSASLNAKDTIKYVSSADCQLAIATSSGNLHN